MRIAVVGTGVAGMVAAYRLAREHELTVFEANDCVGGHAHTVDVAHADGVTAVDTGFIVFNHRTYPRFIALLEELGVAWRPSNMSFSLRSEFTGLEYNGTSLNALFAQRRNLLRPSFLRMLADILRFNRRATSEVAGIDERLTLGEYLEGGRYGRGFFEHYLVPMGAAIWSARPQDLIEFPARFFIEFFHKHGFFSLDDRPVWQTVVGGSRAYVERLTAPYRARIRLRTPVRSIRRLPHEVAVRTAMGEVEHFDAVVLAVHSDQALALLADSSPAERDILSAMRYQANDTVLHTDTALLPRAPLARAAWNYHVLRDRQELAALTYDMNILQSLPAGRPLLVTLNRTAAIDPAKILKRMTYHHPIYTPAAIAAQQRRGEISGVRRTYYCGAYWRYGFHEDGVASAEWAVADLEAKKGSDLFFGAVAC
jgi:predicted NAD/FAD-binding protein